MKKFRVDPMAAPAIYQEIVDNDEYYCQCGLSIKDMSDAMREVVMIGYCMVNDRTHLILSEEVK